MRQRGAPPGRAVVAAFGLPWRDPEPLPGGQERSWLVGDVVFKPVDQIAEHAWVSEVFAAWPADAPVQVPEPLPAGGAWSWAGWGAHRFVPGGTLHMNRDAALIRRSAVAFHQVVSDLPRAAFLDQRDDPWAFGDRVAWEHAPPVGSALTKALVDDVRAAYQPIVSPPQMVHGDIGGNVLGGPGLTLAVIDWPPYWRPVGWSLAVAVVDAICWEGLPFSLLDDWGAGLPDWDQLLLRALVYRIATTGRTEELGTAAMSPEAHSLRVRPLVEHVCARATATLQP